MKEWQYKVTFLTPAFLGDAQQNGRWRTPPFKALLRQWWRVIWAADHDFSRPYDQMRVEEGLLFGNAWLKDKFRKSLVRVRLDRWSAGTLTQQRWVQREAPPTEKVQHPEVNQPIGPMLYLGYGPLLTVRAAQGWATVMKNSTAIAPGESATLAVGIPESHPDPDIHRIIQENIPRIPRVLSLVHSYGTVGGRSRNGWGSLELEPLGDTPPFEETPLPLRDWQRALALDWPHAIATKDNRPLIWRTLRGYGQWDEVMRVLAIVKIALRTQFAFPSTPPPHPTVQDRHLLSYPITKHTTRAWSNTFRLPNSLRFKVRRDRANPQRLIGVIFHIACSPPPAFHANPAQIQSVWSEVHKLLDELCEQPQDRKYQSVSDPKWRAKMPPQLQNVLLER